MNNTPAPGQDSPSQDRPSRHRETLGGQVVAPSSGRPDAEGPTEDSAVAPNVPMGPTHIRPDLGGSGLGLDAGSSGDGSGANGVSGSPDPSTDRPTELTLPPSSPIAPPIDPIPESEPRPRAGKPASGEMERGAAVDRGPAQPSTGEAEVPGGRR